MRHPWDHRSPALLLAPGFAGFTDLFRVPRLLDLEIGRSRDYGNERLLVTGLATQELSGVFSPMREFAHR